MQVLKQYGLTWDTLLEMDIKNNPSRKTFVVPMAWATESVTMKLEETFEVFCLTRSYEDFGNDAIIVLDGYRVGQNLVRNMREWITCSEPSLNTYEQPKTNYESFLVLRRRSEDLGPTTLKINKF